MLDEIMWLVVVISLYGNILIINKKYTGFVVWIFTNTIWAIYDFHIGAIAQGFLFLVFNVFAAFGFLEWKYSSSMQFWKFIVGGYIRSILRR